MKINKIFIYVFFLTFLFAKDEEKLVKINNAFITQYEYGKMLYHNPRGIGCNTCHGEKANGKKIVNFKHTYKKKTYTCTLEVPGIDILNYKQFSQKINSKKNPNKKFKKEEVCEKLVYYANIMPTYFLVEDEIEAIYHYIKNVKN